VEATGPDTTRVIGMVTMMAITVVVMADIMEEATTPSMVMTFTMVHAAGELVEPPFPDVVVAVQVMP
jgi:hypothetical protein